jgi:Relaxase/Mobilisation nuclease domain
MIGKITIGKSFKGCLLYCLNDKLQDPKKEQVMKDRAEILLFNQCYGNPKELIQQFNEVRQLNPKLSKPVLHITLSLVPGEQLPKEKLIEICQDCATNIGFENNQYIAIHHKDTNHQHLHIVANRIGFDKRTVSDSNNFQKIAAYCRKMEMKFNLTQVLSPRKFLPKEHRQIPKQDARKEQLKNNIQKTLHQVNNYQQFEQKMKTLGYQILKARGISFIDDKKIKIKGSEVGFSLMKIEKILALKKESESREIIKEFEKEVLQK